jgi:hypothetical protein
VCQEIPLLATRVNEMERTSRVMHLYLTTPPQSWQAGARTPPCFTDSTAAETRLFCTCSCK